MLTSRADKVTANGPVVTIGSRVRVRDGNYEDTYRIVAPEDSDPATRSISQDSPMARALLGHSVGERVTVHAPFGTRCVTVLNVEAG